jgi:CubicO group peptidase (beta-lactamase class C family)
MIDEFIAHDSKLRFGGLNHGSAAGLNIPYRRLFGRYPFESGLVMLIVSLLVLTPQRLSYGERVRTINRLVASALTTLVCAMQISGASGQPPTAHASVADLFDRAMREWKASFGVSRASVAVMRDNRLIFSAGYGGRGTNERVPVWSLSKAITAVCIASFIKEGRLGLNDPIGPVLKPVFVRFGEPEDERLARVTVAQLLSHRSGIPRAIDDNLFAPGLVQLLRERPPREATIEMLMPQIMKMSLVRAPGTDFEYTNMGYVLLGQIIEALSGKRYEIACAERVLAKVGIKDSPSLDRDWGGIMYAASGWALSGPEYLAFARLLHSRPQSLFTPETTEFLQSSDGKWMNAERTLAYTLGVIIRPVVGSSPNFLHAGGHNWNQNDAAGGPINEARGTSFLLAGDGTAWFASYDGLTAGTNPEATKELDQAFWRARDSVSAWPQHDQFLSMGIEPK